MTGSFAHSEGRSLHVFDMDGTLLRSTATIELARQLGRFDQGQELEERWRTGRITDTDFWLQLLEWCAGADDDDFDEAFFNAPWMSGILETFEDIRDRGESVIVISQSPAFFVRGLQRWGAHETHGSAVEVGRPLSKSATLLPEAKVTITEAAIASRGLHVRQVVAYGDSTSDVSLFARLPFTVGVNATPELQSLAATQYSGTDIRDAYEMGRQMLSTFERSSRSEL